MTSSSSHHSEIPDDAVPILTSSSAVEAEGEAAPPSVTGTAKVMSSAVWNMVGRLGPTVVTLLAVGPLIATLGDARWGVMTIALTLVGTFGIFDLGLGRALTRQIAEDIAHGRENESADLAMSGIVTLGALGLCAALAAAALTGLYVDHGLKVGAGLHDEVRDAIWILCATAPLVLVNAALWGVLSAFQEFKAANLVNLPINVLYYILPLIALQFWNNLCAVMLSLAMCRVAMTIGYALIVRRAMPSLKSAKLKPALLIPLWKIGGWMTASNITYPILMYCDRFIIGAMVPLGMVAFYTTPFDVVSRISIITMALTGSAFPAMAQSFRVDPANTRRVFVHTILTIGAVLMPICLGTAFLAAPLLHLWLGENFAEHSALIAALLCWGTLLGGLDGVASSLIDAIGRPDLNAKFSIGELFVYVPCLYALLYFFGLPGAAISWVLRSTLDCVIRLHLSRRCYAPLAPAMGRIYRLLALITVIFPCVLIPHGVVGGLLGASACISIFAIVFWRLILTAAEREELADRISRLLRRKTSVA